MVVKRAQSQDAPSTGDRLDGLLVAACRMIARYGARKLSFRDVAEEAGVSKALISYYFSGRNDLLARAYEFSDDRARERVSDAFEPVESGAVRLSRVLALYLTDDPNMQEDWILWSELSSAAMFEPDLRPVMEASFVRWTDWIRGLVRDAVEEGSIDIGADADKTTLRLVALTDGLGSLLARGLIEREAAREVLAQHLDASLGRTSRSSTEGSSRAEPPAIGYMRLLAYQLQNAVEQLEGLASTSAERDAIQTVTELIRSRTGQHSMNTPSGERLNKHAERPPLS